MMTAEEARAALTPQQVDGNLKILPFSTEFFSFFSHLIILIFYFLFTWTSLTDQTPKRLKEVQVNYRILTLSQMLTPGPNTSF